MKPIQRKIAQSKIAIIGLGYVGLPLAVEFARHYPTTGFDIKQSRIDELRGGRDSTLEVLDVTGHCAHMSHPHLVTAAMQRYLSLA